jgi:hypothetical protein
VKALRSVRPRLRIKRIRSALYDEAIIDSEPRVLVDVMQQVSSEEAPLRRLQRIGPLLLAHGCQAYLLVADDVAERARERIDDAFAEQEFPALLAVWRSDQPVADLNARLQRLGLHPHPREA